MEKNENIKSDTELKKKLGRRADIITKERVEKVEEIIKTNDLRFDDILENINDWLIEKGRNTVSDRTIRSDLAKLNAGLEQGIVGFDSDLKPIFDKVYKLKDNEDDLKAEKKAEYKKKLKELSKESVKSISVYHTEKRDVNKDYELYMEDDVYYYYEMYELFIKFKKNTIYQQIVTDILYELYYTKIHMISEGIGGIIIYFRSRKNISETLKEIALLLS